MKFIVPERLKAGDKVAILSPSSGLASLFPWVYELGLQRLRDFGLIPVEFSTARKSNEYLQKNPQARADDINKAFSDPEIKAIIATVGGNDQVRILPYLDLSVIQSNPKIFMGYSDCTNLHLVLWNLGIVSYYGGCIMTQFAMQGNMHSYTINSIKKALFENEIGSIEQAPFWTDSDLDWSDQGNLLKQRQEYNATPPEWHNKKNCVVSGRLWGGCLEILTLHIGIQKYMPSPNHLSGAILYVETSEEMPSDGQVYRFIATLGETGLLNKLGAIIVGRPKAQYCATLPPEGRTAYIDNQKKAIKSALEDYNSDLLVIFDLNFGHTDPQIIVPHGGIAYLNENDESITFSYD